MKKVIILMGVPGSGKGTQAKKIAKKFNYTHISTGEMLRHLGDDPNVDEADKQLAEVIKGGNMAPDDLVYKLAFHAINESLTAGKGVVLDGAIRSLNQAKKFDEFFENNGLMNQIVVIEVPISDDEARNRMTKRRICQKCGEIVPWLPATRNMVACDKCGGELEPRIDDEPDVVEKRIREQGNQAIKPILEYYQSLNLLTKVDGMKSIDEVEEDIDKILNDR
jgi:adenylate kinase